jgi:hypothetical protein
MFVVLLLLTFDRSPGLAWLPQKVFVLLRCEIRPLPNSQPSVGGASPRNARELSHPGCGRKMMDVDIAHYAKQSHTTWEHRAVCAAARIRSSWFRESSRRSICWRVRS